MIISASRRTDIPAFYAEWFMRRLREGFCETRNPFNPAQVSRVSLAPADVDVIAFISKNPAPLLPHLDEIDAHWRSYFQFTLNAYDREFEANLPPVDQRISYFEQLSAAVGASRVIWRYDPIIISNLTPVEFHLKRFAELARALDGLTRRVVISFVDRYRRIEKPFQELETRGIRVDWIPGEDALRRVSEGILEETARRDMEVFSCGEPFDLSRYGIARGSCVDALYIRRVLGVDVKAGKDPNQRPECGCAPSKDIGAYDTCLHGCRYCYAASPGAAQRNHERHRPDSAGLLG